MTRWERVELATVMFAASLWAVVMLRSLCERMAC